MTFLKNKTYFTKKKSSKNLEINKFINKYCFLQHTRDSRQDLSQSFSRWKMENGWRSTYPARDMCRPKVCVPWEHVFTLRHGNYLCQRKRHETLKENRALKVCNFVSM